MLPRQRAVQALAERQNCKVLWHWQQPAVSMGPLVISELRHCCLCRIRLCLFYQREDHYRKSHSRFRRSKPDQEFLHSALERCGAAKVLLRPCPITKCREAIEKHPGQRHQLLYRSKIRFGCAFGYIFQHSPSHR